MAYTYLIRIQTNILMILIDIDYSCDWY